MGCYAMLTGKWLRTIQMNTVLPFSGSRSPVPLLCLTLKMEALNPSKTSVIYLPVNIVEHPRRPKSSLTPLWQPNSYMLFLVIFNYTSTKSITYTKCKWPGDCELQSVQDITIDINVPTKYSVTEITKTTK